jgi:hypothetical protein
MDEPKQKRPGPAVKGNQVVISNPRPGVNVTLPFSAFGTFSGDPNITGVILDGNFQPIKGIGATTYISGSNWQINFTGSGMIPGGSFLKVCDQAPMIPACAQQMIGSPSM